MTNEQRWEWLGSIIPYLLAAGSFAICVAVVSASVRFSFWLFE